MNSITTNEIRQICIAIARAWPYGDYRINTFAQLEKSADWHAGNFNKGYIDYRDGTYWVRDKNHVTDNKAESGYLVMEDVGTVFKDFESDTGTMDIWFTVALDRTCLDCPDDQKVSIQILEDKAQEMMRQFLKEFFEYRVYKITDPDPDIDIWASPTSIAQLKTKNGWTTEIEQHSRVGSLIDEVEPFEIRRQMLGAAGKVGVSVNLKITQCNTSTPPSWDYSKDDIEQGAVVVCDTCG